MDIKNIKPGVLAVSIILPLCLGGISAMLTRDMMKEYFFLNKPPLSPPGWVFPIVWTILYVLMGLAAYLVCVSGADEKIITRALTFYSIQLVLNFVWSLLFFNHSLYLLSFIELCLMLAAIVIGTVYFFKASSLAGALMIPYIFWTGFAGYLNIAVYKLSITPMPLHK